MSAQNFHTDPTVTSLSDGGFVVVWKSFTNARFFDIYGQRFDAKGKQIGDEFLISNDIDGNQEDPTVTALTNGGFAVAWHSNDVFQDIQARIFDGRLFGTNSKDTLVDTFGAGWMHGRNGNDTLRGLGGKDKMFGGKGNDTLNGNKGNDRLVGEKGNDVLRGDQGNDIILGGGGAGVLVGGAGNDSLKGDAGKDWLHGSAGENDLWGGGGVDVFIYKSTANEDLDRIRDFVDSTDKINLKAYDFANFNAISAKQSGAHVKLGLGTDKVLVIQNLVLADFDAGDVIL